jgi:CHASE2 domain-containing sensor protein
VATLSIDARTRSARPIHTPFLAMLEEQRLGIGLLARDADGVVRRFSILVPTEDGGFPTLAGRLCRELSRQCGDGFIHFALGAPFRQVPFHQVLEATDAAMLERAFKDRIVLIGETAAFTGRIEVPVNYAGWERAPRDSPSVVVHAQSLRTALADAAPAEASRPLLLILVAAAALVYLARDWRLALAIGALAMSVMLFASVMLLRGGLVLPLGAAFATVALAWAGRAVLDLSRRFAIRRR